MNLSPRTCDLQIYHQARLHVTPVTGHTWAPKSVTGPGDIFVNHNQHSIYVRQFAFFVFTMEQIASIFCNVSFARQYINTVR